MLTCTGSILASRPFEFIVGTNEKLFTVHSALVAHHSKPLNALINGHMIESNAGRVNLANVDEATFVLFCEFAYTRDYTSQELEILLSADDVKVEDQEYLDAGDSPTEPQESQTQLAFQAWQAARSDVHMDEVAVPAKPVKAKVTPFGPLSTKKKKQDRMWIKFQRRQYPVSLAQPFSPPQNHEPCEDFSGVFLAHAKLYVFADQWDVRPLRNLVLYKLHQTLCNFTLYQERVVDIVELLEYAYDNEHIKDRQGKTVDQLRVLLCSYVACALEDLRKSEDFEDLLEEKGALGHDIIDQLTKHLD